jgi:hypothetical protein
VVLSVSILTKALYTAALATLFLNCSFALAESSSSLSVEIHSSKILTTQQKVDRLYEAGDFERALFLYRNELAPLGDKYAQYMVGHMYSTGTGVAASAITACAWYQLAAELGNSEFSAAFDYLQHSMTDEQIFESDLLYSHLRIEFSDLTILLTLVKRDFDELNLRTGTRSNGDMGSSWIVETREDGISSSVGYYGNVRERLQERLEMIKDLGDFEDFETNPDKVEFRELERLVTDKLKVGQ